MVEGGRLPVGQTGSGGLLLGLAEQPLAGRDPFGILAPLLEEYTSAQQRQLDRQVGSARVGQQLVGAVDQLQALVPVPGDDPVPGQDFQAARLQRPFRERGGQGLLRQRPGGGRFPSDAQQLRFEQREPPVPGLGTGRALRRASRPCV